MERLLRFTVQLLLFLLPWQTMWIIREKFVAGVKWEYATIGFYATEGVLWLAVSLFIPWFYQQYKKTKQPAFRLTRDRIFTIAVLLFIIYGYASSLWSADRDIALQHALWVLEASLLFFLLLASQITKRDMLSAFVLGAAMQSVIGIFQFLTQTAAASSLFGMSVHTAAYPGTSILETVNGERWLRAYGTLPHPNILGGYLVIGIMATQQLVDLVQTKSTRPLLIGASLIQTMALFFTFSRSAWLAFAIWGVVSLITRRPAKTIAYHALFLAVLTALFFPLVSERIIGTTLPQTRSTEERISGYNEAVLVFRTKPLFGAGIGNYTQTLRELIPDRPIWTYQPVHNVPLLLLVEVGIIGAFLFAAAVASLYKLKAKSMPAHAGYKLFLVIVPLLLFDHYLFSSHIGLLLLALFPMLSTIHPQEE